MASHLPLIEMFGPTIQGEGAVIGQQTYFLRFGHCDYRCKMCDSMHAVDPIQIKKNAEWLTQQQIFDKFMAFKEPNSTDWITYSGGNPCVHDLSQLTFLLKCQDIKIAVETQGTIFREWLKDCDIVTVSPKGPGMGEEFDPIKFDRFMNLFEVTWHRNYSRVNLKVVVFDLPDIEFVQKLIAWCHDNHFPLEHFYLSQGNPYPPNQNSSPRLAPQLHTSILRDKYLSMFSLIKNLPEISNLKFLPQMHVWLWSNKQGV